MEWWTKIPIRSAYMVTSKDSECISFLHPLLWMLAPPPSSTMKNDWNSVVTSISNSVFLQRGHWTASHVGYRTLRFDSHCGLFSYAIPGCLRESWPFWAYRSGAGWVEQGILILPQHLCYLVSQSACAVVVWCLPTSPLHDLQWIARGTCGTCG